MFDTSAEAFQVQAHIFNQMSPVQRFKLGLQMIADGCLILENRLRQQMPDSSISEQKSRRFEELYREDLSAEQLAACVEGLKAYWQQQSL